MIVSSRARRGIAPAIVAMAAATFVAACNDADEADYGGTWEQAVDMGYSCAEVEDPYFDDTAMSCVHPSLDHPAVTLFANNDHGGAQATVDRAVDGFMELTHEGGAPNTPSYVDPKIERDFIASTFRGVERDHLTGYCRYDGDKSKANPCDTVMLEFDLEVVEPTDAISADEYVRRIDELRRTAELDLSEDPALE